MSATRRRLRASSTRRSTSGKPEKSAWTSSSSAFSVVSNRRSIWEAVGPRGEASWSRGRGCAESGSRRSASRVTLSGAARYVATKASASRVRRACRRTASARRFCSEGPKGQRVNATESDRLPVSRRILSSEMRRRVKRSRRSTQVFFRPRSFEIAAGERRSSSDREATTRASSIGLVVLGGELASRIRALEAKPLTGSRTTGTFCRPSLRHWARRLNPSRTSRAPPSVAATRRGSGERSLCRSVR